jgi:hypothetical protein
MMRTFRSRFWWLMTVLATLSGVLYSSWPLGYWFNPAVSKTGLASGLEALHQPYNWVFIAADIASSLLIILVCWLIWQRLKHAKQRRLLDAVVLNVGIFGAGTIADTLLPMHCEPSLQHCPSFTVDYYLLFHGIFSILAAACLFFGLALLWWHHRRNLILISLMFGYMLFSLFSLFEILGWLTGNWSQHFYLTLCSVLLALLPYAVHSVLVEKPRAAEAT